MSIVHGNHCLFSIFHDLAETDDQSFSLPSNRQSKINNRQWLSRYFCSRKNASKSVISFGVSNDANPSGISDTVEFVEPAI
jgi:hypothetical protein